MLILVRHGRTVANAERRLLGRMDLDLDELGLRQAAAIGATLAGECERVVCSPLARTRQTAEALGRPVTVDDRWIEIDYGVLDGKPLAEVPPEVFRGPPQWAPEGGESVLQLNRRVRAAAEELLDEAGDKHIAVVTHVGPIRAAVCWALGVDERAALNMFVGVASISVIGRGPRSPYLVQFNRVDHRPDE